MSAQRTPKRTLDKWHRLAYELEHDASRERSYGRERAADSIGHIASQLGRLVRSLESE